MSRLKEEQKKIQPIELSEDLFVIHIFPKESIYVYVFRDFSSRFQHYSVPVYRWFWNNSIQVGSQRTVELRPFNKIFEMLDRKYSSSQVYDDFLSMSICAFAMETMESEYLEIISRYDKPDITLFTQLFAEMVNVINPRLQDWAENNPVWYDFFGDYYQVISAKARLGQFFTPEHLVTMIANMNIDTTSSGLRILDPASGSGRFLIASHSLNPKNIHYGIDLDLMCCKMTILNMFFHGCKGEVIWGNSLALEYYKGWAINPDPNYPYIIEIPKEKSFHYNYWEQIKQESNQAGNAKPVIKNEPQLNIFG